MKGWERLPREEIVTRACQAVAAVALEKRRNAELVYRLQQAHQEGLEARQLKRRYEELQVGLSSVPGSLTAWPRLAACVCVCVCVCVSGCLAVSLSVCLSVRLSVCPAVCLPACLPALSAAI